MEAITKKYLDLYAALSGELQERPQLLNHYREAAYDAFARLGVPRFKSEDYQRTDLPSLFAEDWKLRVLDGAPYWASQAFAPEIFIGAFSDFVRLHPELAQEYYGRIAPIATDGLVALNTLFAAEALVIYVPRGAKIPGHIELSYILPRLAGHISVERALIILEDDAEATLHFRDCPETTERAMALRTIEVHVGRRARFSLIEREESAEANVRVSSLYVRQMQDSVVDLSGVTLRNGVTRNNYSVTLAEERADLKVSGFVLTAGRAHADNFSYIEHAVPHCTSDELFKYVLRDDSRGVFTGRILVAQDAQKTQAYQNNRNLLLSPLARMQSKPQLEIYADDVKCAHGTSTGQLDQEAMFYMQQRGISKANARMLLMYAFAAEISNHIGIPAMQERIDDMIKRRLRGELSSCDNCVLRCSHPKEYQFEIDESKL